MRGHSVGDNFRSNHNLSRFFGSIPATRRRVPHISLVFREMWDTASLAFKPVTGSQLYTGARRCTCIESAGSYALCTIASLCEESCPPHLYDACRRTR
jgi:hypothetical protein